MGGYGYEMEGGNSYTLREVITKKFGSWVGLMIYIENK